MKNRMDSLQVIKALAFLGIFASHSEIIAFSGAGEWGVSVFLVLSGFLMFCSYWDTDRIKDISLLSNIKFGIGKVKKLYPLHIATMFTAIILELLFKNRTGIVQVVKLSIKTILNVLLLQAWIPFFEVYFSLNSVAWYLSVLLFLYIMFPFILRIMQGYKGIGTAIKVAILLFVLQIIMAYISYRIQVDLVHDDGFIHWFTYIFPISRLEDFIIGCNIGYIFKKTNENIKEKTSKTLFSFLEAGIVILILTQLVMYVLMISIPAKENPTINSENWWGLTFYWTITSCALIYLFAINQGKLSKALTNTSLLFVGNMSANAYLIHQIVYRYLNAIESKIWGETNEYINIILCYILTMASSYIWEKIIEHYRCAKLKKQGETVNY